MWLFIKLLIGKILSILKGRNKHLDNNFQKEVVLKEKTEPEIEPKINFKSIKHEIISDYINEEKDSSETVQKKMSFKEEVGYVPPMIDILSSPKTSAKSIISKEELDNNAQKLKAVLADFKIEAEDNKPTLSLECMSCSQRRVQKLLK